MSDLPAQIFLREVGPREGFQFEPPGIPTAAKIDLIDRLGATGLRFIQVTNYANPKRLPQMADAEEVAAGFTAAPGVEYEAIFMNEKGLDRALAAGKFDVQGHLLLSTTDTFSRRNTGKGVDEAVLALADDAALYARRGVPVRGLVLMAAFGCNYDGDVSVEKAVDLLTRAVDATGTPTWIQLADTMGWATPSHLSRLVGSVRDRWPDAVINLHLHDTRGAGMANVLTALQLGVDEFDSSVAGLGGCPFAGHNGAAGNVATEDVAFMAREMGVDPAVDLDALVDCARVAEQVVGHPLPGKLMKGGTLRAIRDARSAA